VLLGAFGPGLAHADPDALWKVVHGQCVPDMTSGNSPAPCLSVDLGAGWAALKDRNGATQVLVIPTDRITGIESPILLRKDAPNYWQDAWTARVYVEKLAGRPIPREDLGLAVNSQLGRTQNQLHIHVDCLRPDVRDTLSAGLVRIGPKWARFPMPLAGRHYIARRLDGPELDERNPFKLLAEADRRARADMGRETLVVAGIRLPDGRPGFVILADRADPAHADFGSGEELQDHACHVLIATPTAAPKF
jgi:CDP-diacylglycerol pyrophosphatase